MRRFRWAALIVAGIISFFGSAAYAQVCIDGGGSNSATGSGWVAGGHAGYNWQQGSWVYGLETDLSGTGLKSSMSGGLLIPCPGDIAETSAKINWYGTVRGRAGWAAGNVLFYGTGGFAYGKVDLSSYFSTVGQTLNSDTSSVRAGWVAGGGVEYMVRPDLFLNLGYQYVDLGTASLASADTIGGHTVALTASTHAAFHVVTIGFNWRFYPTPTMPWEGAYIGGHAGGAWGLNTDASYSSQNVIPSDVRLKRDIALVGRRDDGVGLYRYRYQWSDTVYVGVMAQEVALIHPDAIVRDTLDDYLKVDYGRLGLRLMTLPEWDVKNKGASL